MPGPRFILTFFLLLCNISIVRSQTSRHLNLFGIAYIINSNHSPAYPVEIKVPEKSSVIINQSNGTFRLVLTDVKYGDKIQLKVKYKDWVVVNQDVTSRRIPLNTDYDTIQIILAPAQQINDAKVKYYNISMKAVEDNYKRKINLLEKNAAGYQEKADQILKEKGTLQNKIDELSTYYSRVNLDDITPVQKKAFEAFLQGDLTGALQILETVDSKSRISLLIKDRQNALNITGKEVVSLKKTEVAFKVEIEKLIFQAQLYELQFDFDKAESLYNLAVQSDKSYSTIYNYSFFCYDRGRYQKSLRFAQLALPEASSEDSLHLMNMIGSDYFHLDELDSAIVSLQTALSIVKHTQDYTILRSLKAANININLALSYLEKKDNAAAEATLAVTLQMLSSLDFTLLEPNDLAAFGGIVQQMSNIFQEKFEPDYAMDALQFSIEVFSKFADIDSLQYTSLIANSKYKIGKILISQHQLKDAWAYLNEALFSFKKLNTYSPHLYDSKLADVYLALGSVYRDYGDSTKSRKAIDSSFYLLKKNGQADLIDTYNAYARLYADFGISNKAVYYYKILIPILSKLTAQNFDKYAMQLSGCYGDLAIIHLDKNDYDSARKYALGALQIDSIFNSRHPGEETGLLYDYNNLAAIEYKQGHYQAAEANYLQSFALAQKLAQLSPGEFEPMVGSLYINLALLYKETNRVIAAKDLLQKALIYFEKKPEAFKDEIKNVKYGLDNW